MENYWLMLAAEDAFARLLEPGSAIGVITGANAVIPFEKTDNDLMKKALVIPLTEKELQEVYRILIDRDQEGAWEFLNAQVRAPLLKAMTGG